MIRRLRRRFISIAMLCFALVLAAVLGVLNMVNYQQLIAEADQLLTLISENRGAFPHVQSTPRRKLPPRMLSPEAPYENRFFAITLSADGDVVRTNMDQIAAIGPETAVDYAMYAAHSQKHAGNRGIYRYHVQELENGERLITFLDCGRSMESARSYLRTSIALYGCALAVVFGVLTLLSRRAIRPVLESNEKQKQFITDAGHEIKTPITIIDADAAVLSMELGQNEWVEDIQAQAKRLALLTADLISLSQMEETGAKPTMIDLPFSDLVVETAQGFQTMARAQRLSFTCEVEPMLSVHGEEKSLRQLVTILLENALKYATAEGKIRLKLERAGRNVRLHVENPCQPISQEQLGRLFDRFYRVDSARTQEKGGYGIGLSIAKAVVEAHKGRIAAHCHDGAWLTMTVTLPAVRTDTREYRGTDCRGSFPGQPI